MGGFQHSRRTIREPEEFSDAVSGVELRVDFQRRQERASAVEQFQAAGWALDFGEANVRTRVGGVLRGGWASLCLTLGRGEAVWNGERAAPGSLCLLPPGVEVDGRTTADYHWLTAAVPPAGWEECQVLAGIEPAGVACFAPCRLPDALAARIAEGLAACRRELGLSAGDPRAAARSSARARGKVLELFTIACTRVARQPPGAGSSSRNRLRLARRAERWMLDRLGEEFRVADLCLALRVSRRELEYAFRAVFDQGPREHLEVLRLNAIRRALRRAGGGERVTAIAFAHGVRHLGRFAARYRALFGELPSGTLGE
jgi:AraC family ethanolamine operon transcriptional activator